MRAACRSVVAARVDGEDYKLFHLLFNDATGAVVVGFPYGPVSEGIGAEVCFPPNARETTIDLRNVGKITSHPVEFSQQRDGRARFSQDGKVIAREIM